MNTKRQQVFTAGDFQKDPSQQEADFLKRRQEFTVQISMYNAIFGIRFAGKLKYSELEITPWMKLEKIPAERLKQFRVNNLTRTPEALKEAGFTKVMIPSELTFFERVKFLIPKYRRWAFIQLYTSACLRFNMLYFTFIAEQQGAFVAAVDVRDMTADEREGLLREKVAVQLKINEGEENAKTEEAAGAQPSNGLRQEPS